MVHDPSTSGSELPEDWADQITRAYETFGVEEFAKRRITPKMRAAWARMRRRGSGTGGGQFMPNVVAKIPPNTPILILPPEDPGPERPPVVVVQEEEEEEELLPTLRGSGGPPRIKPPSLPKPPRMPLPPRPPRLPVEVEQPPELSEPE